MDNKVLNLIITGIPSIPKTSYDFMYWCGQVLNLIITGIPSILSIPVESSFINLVLNLIITGIPSIPNTNEVITYNTWEF